MRIDFLFHSIQIPSFSLSDHACGTILGELIPYTEKNKGVKGYVKINVLKREGF